MNVTFATRPGSSDRPNEDWAGAITDTVVVLDGVTAPKVAAPTCGHSVPWFVGYLGAHLLRLLPGRDLGEGLADAIEATNHEHAGTCDLSGPGVPAATVGILRARGADLEYLVLADVTVVLDVGADVRAVTDTRVEQAAPVELAATRAEAIGTPEHAAAVARMSVAQLQARNRPGGYWVASSDPSAAGHALRGSVPLGEVRRAALMTDGASRLVDVFGVMDWAGYLRAAEEVGPAALLDTVREVERSDPEGRRWPRFKRSDDATAALVCV